MKLRSVVVLTMLAGACARASLNRAEVDGPHEESVKATDVPVLGSPVEVRWSCGEDRSCTTEGELIAVNREFVYVDSNSTTPGTADRHAIERAKISEVYVEVSKSHADALGGWTALGCASTLSHGYYLGFTGPVWLAAGISSSVAESRRSHALAWSHDLDALYQFARYPQGLPSPDQRPALPSTASASAVIATPQPPPE
jgi:hypothetical protein